MRLLIHILIVLMIVGMAGGVATYHVHSHRDEAKRTFARTEVARFQQQIHLRAALASAEGGADTGGGPDTVDPEWFRGVLPVNPFLGPEHPWLEIAGPEQRTLLHPTSLTVADGTTARFWYNPALGIVRARVPVGISDAQALDLYNDINDSELVNLFCDP